MIEIKFTGSDWHDIDYQMAEFRDAQNKVVETAQEVKVETKEEAPTLTLAEVKKQAKAKLDEGKSGEVKELLKKMDVKKVGDLQEEQFAEFVKGLEAL